MEIIFREIHHTNDEISMGQKIWFPISIESDAVSATANTNGFVPLTAIARSHRWPNILIEEASLKCNQENQIAVLDQVKPALLLVPATKGEGPTDFLITDLIKAANAVKADVLNFTHFGFIQSMLPEREIKAILRVMMDANTKSTIRVVVWDIDFRFKKAMMKIWRETLPQNA